MRDDDTSAPWRGLLRAAVILLIVVGLLVHAYVQVPIPPVIIFLVVFGVVLSLLAREGKARTVGVVLGGVGSVLFILGNLPFVVEDLSHPDSALAFLASGMGVVGSLVGLVAMLGALLHWPAGGVTLTTAAGGVLLVGVIVVAGLGLVNLDSDTRQPGDIVLVAEDADYAPEGEDPDREADVRLTVPAGGAVFVDNKDLYRHTFVIEGLGIDEEVPAGSDQRVVIEAEPGEYEFFCDVSGHEEDMRGTLVVE
jgi:plastocyanin